MTKTSIKLTKLWHSFLSHIVLQNTNAKLQLQLDRKLMQQQKTEMDGEKWCMAYAPLAVMRQK